MHVGHPKPKYLHIEFKLASTDTCLGYILLVGSGVMVSYVLVMVNFEFIWFV